MARRLLLYALLYALARAVLVASLADVFFYGEELAKAASARAIVADAPIAHARLAYHAYEGGGFALAHVEALVFALLGPSVLALKVVALGWGTAILVLGARLCERRFGVFAGAAFAVLWILAPATFQQLSLLALGIHFEALLFVLIVLERADRILAEEAPPLGVFAGLGFGAGLGLWFSYTLVPLIAGVAAVLLVLRRRSFHGFACLALGSGFAVGYSPWLWMATQLGDAMFDVHGAELAPGGGGLAVLASSAAAACPWIAGLALLALLAPGRRGGEPGARGLALAALAGLVLYLGALLGVGLVEVDPGHFFARKRLALPWLLLVLLAAATLGRLAARPEPALRWLPRVLLAIVAVLGLADLARLVRAGAPTTPVANLARLDGLRGTSWTAYVRAVATHLEGDERTRAAALARLDPADPTTLYPAIAHALWGESRLPTDAVFPALQAVDPARWHAFLPGLGTWWRIEAGPAIAARTARAAAEFEPAVAAALLEATGRDAVGPRVNPEILRRQIARGRDRALPDGFFEALGTRMPDSMGLRPDAPARPWILFPADVEAFLATLDPTAAALLRRGLARGIAEREL